MHHLNVKDSRINLVDLSPSFITFQTTGRAECWWYIKYLLSETLPRTGVPEPEEKTFLVMFNRCKKGLTFHDVSMFRYSLT